MYGLIKKYEGCYLDAYKCPAGIWTIGWGNTTIDGRPVKEGDHITEEKADKMLQEFVDTEILPKIKFLGLKGKQQEAFVSLCYNIGITKILGDTDLIKAIQKKDYAEIYKNWTWGFKNNLPGLYKRRAEEICYFMSEI